MNKKNLIVKNLTKSYRNVIAINNISFEVDEGKVLTLLGPSGCGKTTTLLSIAGILKPDKGFISIAGEVYTDVDRKIFILPEKRNIGIVFQSYALWPHMTVYDNISYPLKLRKYPKNEIRERVEKMLELVELKGLEDRYPYQLSGGQQQRVALARALVYEPKILLLDEPLSNLDARVRDNARFWLREFQKRFNITVVYVTHDQAEAMVISDVIAVMNNGKILQTGSPREIYEKPINSFVASFIGNANILPAIIDDIDKENRRYIIKIGDKYIVESTNAAYHDFHKGERCLISFKPNRAKIFEYNERAKNKHNIIEGILVHKAYLGGLYEYRINFLESDREIRVISERNVGEEKKSIKIFTSSNELIVLPFS